jgi:magnesium-transporting ATPase (P-type)
MKDYNDHYDIFKTNIDSYTSLYEYQMYLGGIINENFNFLEKIKNKINTYKQNNFIDNRKNSYLSSNLEFYKNIHFYIFILYYTIFIAFLIFSNFIKDKLYENKYVMIYVLVILIIPFILRYILLFIYNLYTNYIESNYLKLDEISYKYLVEETYHQKKNEKDEQQLNNFHAIRNGN